MPRINLYVKDTKVLREVQKRIKKLWYLKYGEALTNGNLTMKALLYLEIELSGDIRNNDNKRQDLHKYGRTGL